jgi:hypothetical protein
MAKKGTIAIDADGVMLDYNIAFKDVYEKAFNTTLELVDENAFHATNMWGLKAFEKDEKETFYKVSHEYAIWKKMPAIKDAVESVNKLVDMGYEVVCVTSMPTQYEQDRLENLQQLGFNINKVIATSRVSDENPKKKYIEELCPLYFVDDLLKNFDDISCATKLVYVNRGYSEDPNAEHNYIKYDQEVSSLKEFVDFVIKNEDKKDSKKKVTI